MSKSDTWLAVDRAGLGKLLERRGKGFAAVELISNAFDEQGVTEVDVTLRSIEGHRGLADLRVADDAPDGFKDLRHAYTLFAESAKKGDAELRGRFNLGEKLVLAIAKEAAVLSTTGSVYFQADGTRKLGRAQRQAGSVFHGTVTMTKAEIIDAIATLHTVIVPDGITLTVNDETIAHRAPVRTTRFDLPTEIADDEGVLRRTSRITDVELYEPLPGEKAMIYELGIPVVEHDGKWDVNVAQKVPLNFDRDNVTPRYLRKVRTLMVDVAADLLDAEEAAKPWVAEGIEEAKPERVNTVLDRRFGEKRVIADPSDPEATKRAIDQGYAVIHGGALSKRGWEAVKATGSTKAAGVVMPSGVDTSPDGKPPLDESDWTPGMRRMADYALAVGKHLIGIPVQVAVTSQFGATYAATFGGFPKRLTFNVANLGHAWFDSPDVERVDALLIHEFAHNRVSDHLSDSFHDECCRLGAKLRSCTARLDEGR